MGVALTVVTDVGSRLWLTRTKGAVRNSYCELVVANTEVVASTEVVPDAELDRYPYPRKAPWVALMAPL